MMPNTDDMLVVDRTISGLQEACYEVLQPDERGVVFRALERVERDRAAVNMAAKLRRQYGINGKELERRTLKNLQAMGKFHTQKLTIHTVKSALHKTEYGRRCKNLHSETQKKMTPSN